MLPLAPVVYDLGLIAGGYLLDRFFNRSSSTPNLPVPVPQGAPSPATIPTTRPRNSVLSRADDLIELVSGLRNNSNTNIQNTTNNYTQNTSNIINNYNNQQTITSEVKNMPTTTLLETLASNGAGALALKGSLDDLVAATASSSAVSAAVGGAIYSKLDDLVAAVYVVASAIYENGANTATVPDNTNINTNIFDTAPLVSAISALGDLINPPERTDFYTTTTAVNEYKITPAPVTDIFGNDPITASPLEIATMKNIGVATSTALENSTTAEDVGLDDILSDYEGLGTDFLKIFQFNGITENLQAISEIAENDFATHIPNVNLREVL